MDEAIHSKYAVGKAYVRKRAVDIRDFLENVLFPAFPHTHIYMIWDNLSSHKCQREWQKIVKEQIKYHCRYEKRSDRMNYLQKISSLG